MAKKELVRKRLVKRHSYDVKPRSPNVPQVKRPPENTRKVRAPKKDVKDKGTPEQQKCCICMDTRKFREREKQSCGHSFHKNCINRWLQDSNSCPVCRKPIKELEEQEVIRRRQQLSSSGQITDRQVVQSARELRQRGLQIQQQQVRQRSQQLSIAPGRIVVSVQTRSAIQMECLLS